MKKQNCKKNFVRNGFVVAARSRRGGYHRVLRASGPDASEWDFDNEREEQEDDCADVRR
jgi:hypothetical protein